MSFTLDDVLQSKCYKVKTGKNKKKTLPPIVTQPDNISIPAGNQFTNEDKSIFSEADIKTKDNPVNKLKDNPTDKLKDKPNNKSKDKKIDYIKDDIDNILDNDLMNFDNKHQMSMYYIACKSLKYFNKQLLSEYNITIPETLYNSVIIEIIPNLIKEYTSNVKKRCKKNVDINLICIGRKLDGKQCSRKKSINNEYCKSHLKKIINMNTQKKDENNKTVIRNKRLSSLKIPLVSVGDGKKRKYYWDMDDFKAAKPTGNIRYLKGLGSLSLEDWEWVMSRKDFVGIDENSDSKEKLEMAFGDSSEARKKWLSNIK